MFIFVSPDGVSAFPEVRVKTPFKGLEGIIAIHGGGRGELSEEDGEGTLLGFEQDSAHCGKEGLAVRSFVGVSDASEVLLEVGNTRAGFEEGRVARFGVFCKDAELVSKRLALMVIRVASSSSSWTASRSSAYSLLRSNHVTIRPCSSKAFTSSASREASIPLLVCLLRVGHAGPSGAPVHA